jgi:2,4-dienoyl-CoA reductase-like NADH-dependent reductase (Old Yellow Enzyme family)
MSQKLRNKFYDKAYKIKDFVIPSRFFLAPINTGFVKMKQPSNELIEFHSKRSGNKIGISYIGNIAIGPEFVTNKNTLYFTDEFNRWEELIAKIHNNNSLSGIQLGCRYSKIPPIRKWENRNIDSYIKEVKNEMKSFSEEFINNVIDKYVESAIIANKLGVKVIQIHGAHGYFLSLFLSDIFNSRDDKYGENRILLLEKIVNKIRDKLPNIILDVRISLLEGIKLDELSISEYKDSIIEEIVQLDIDIISISNGIYNINKQYIYPPLDWGHAVYLPQAIELANKYKEKLWNVAGNIYDIDMINFNIPENITFSIGRSLIADPHFVKNCYLGKLEEVNRCIRCGLCHYYSKGKSNLSCKISGI